MRRQQPASEVPQILLWQSGVSFNLRPMPDRHAIAVIVSTYQRPRHLERCLFSLSKQHPVDNGFEVVVTDDGSQDETASLVDRLAREMPYPLRFVTQPQEGFRLARCRNNGARASRAPYMLFTDGDCVFPANHLAQHAAAREVGTVRAGDCIRLDQVASQQIDKALIEQDAIATVVSAELLQIAKRSVFKARFYEAIRSKLRPKLVGANIGCWRSDFERVNGFDESFVGWGCEDDDFARRLRAAGLRVRTVLDRTVAYHLWHPPHETAPESWRHGGNVSRLTRPAPLARCLQGLQRRAVSDLFIRVVNRRCRWFHSAWPNGVGPNAPTSCELQLLVLPGEGEFADEQATKVVVAPPGVEPSPEIAEAADMILSLPDQPRTPDELFEAVGKALGEAA